MVDTSHCVYEDYVDENWTRGYNYRSIVSNNTYSIRVDNPGQAAEELANESNSYSDDLWNAVHSNPQSFGSDIDVRFITSHMIRKTARYNLGLVQYISTTNRTPEVTYVSGNTVFSNQSFANNFTVIGIHPIYNDSIFYVWSDGIGNSYTANRTYSSNGSMVLQDVCFKINVHWYPDPHDNVRELAQYIADDEYEESYDINVDGNLGLVDLILLNNYVREHF